MQTSGVGDQVCKCSDYTNEYGCPQEVCIWKDNTCQNQNQSSITCRGLSIEQCYGGATRYQCFWNNGCIQFSSPLQCTQITFNDDDGIGICTGYGCNPESDNRCFAILRCTQQPSIEACNGKIQFTTVKTACLWTDSGCIAMEGCNSLKKETDCLSHSECRWINQNNICSDRQCQDHSSPDDCSTMPKCMWQTYIIPYSCVSKVCRRYISVEECRANQVYCNWDGQLCNNCHLTYISQKDQAQQMDNYNNHNGANRLTVFVSLIILVAING